LYAATASCTIRYHALRRETVTPSKETLPSPASTKPEFTGLTEAEVRKAVQEDTEGEGRIVAEVNRLVALYTTLYMDCVKRNGPVTPLILYVRADWPIERVAVEIVVVGFSDGSRTEPVSIH
jgi:hypothetical protein